MLKKKNKKLLIREAAAQLFREKGYAATSMRDLARAVNLEASSLYNHIGSKAGLLCDICFENAQHYLEEMDRVEKMDSNAGEKVKALIYFHIRMATEDITSIMAFNDEWRHLEEPHLTEFKKLRKNYEGRFRDILDDGMARGEFKSAHPNIVLYTIFSSIRWLHDWYKPGHTVTPEQLQRDMAQLLLSGLMEE
jgi:AcrR family transcriptional regulator